MTDSLTQAEAALAKMREATAGPWEARDWKRDDGNQRFMVSGSQPDPDRAGYTSPWPDNVRRIPVCDVEYSDSPEKSAAAIVAAHNALEAFEAIVAELRERREAAPKSSAEFHQRRGMLADTVQWAVNVYDEYMRDDHFDPQGKLDAIIQRLRQVLADLDGAR